MKRTRIVSCLAGIGVCLFLFAFSLRAQTSDDQVWNDFVTYLRGAPVARGPRELIKGYQEHLAKAGVDDAESARRLEIVLRLMRDRPDAWPVMFDKIYASDNPNFSTKPNAWLMAAVQGRPPGRALDVGVGQGRNAIALARLGWDVTGFDVSAEGLAVAKAEAARAGVPLTVVQTSSDDFDFGANQWDLIDIIYTPVPVTDPAYVARLERSLRPGGIVIIDTFASEKTAKTRRPVDVDPGELLKAFESFRILNFADTEGVTDWDPQTTSLVRLVAQTRK